MPIKHVISAIEEKHNAEINKAEGKAEEKDKSEVSTLMRIAHKDATFFHCDGRGYVTINKEKDIRPTYLIREEYQDWLTAAYYNETKRPVSQQNLKTCYKYFGFQR